MAAEDPMSFGILAGNNINAVSGETKVQGNLAFFNSMIGSGTVLVIGQSYNGSAISQALENAQNNYNFNINLDPTYTSSSADIGGTSFSPGVIRLTNPAGINISSPVTLTGDGDYLFQVPNGGISTDSSTTEIYFNLFDSLFYNAYFT